MPEEKTVMVALGDQQKALDERMASGKYDSPSEVVQEALQALEREDAMIDDLINDKVLEALDDASDQEKAAAVK